MHKVCGQMHIFIGVDHLRNRFIFEAGNETKGYQREHTRHTLKNHSMMDHNDKASVKFCYNLQLGVPLFIANS